MKVIVVGGTFDTTFGKPSGYVFQLAEALRGIAADDVTLVNGGSLRRLVDLAGVLGEYDAAIWMPDVDNDVPKIVDQIKALFPKLLLVTSKRNFIDVYTTEALLQRALHTKSNLLLVLTGSRYSIKTTILDPLGSAFVLEETDIGIVAKVLRKKLSLLTTFTRVGSKSIGPAIQAPDVAGFFEIIRTQAENFHAIIHGVEHSRMLGNASFRCAKGFPSMRAGEVIFVSRRDVDKRFIDRDTFVAVTPYTPSGPVCYYGDVKPSVDTPIQLKLYNTYPNVNYMLHSHTYIEGASMTGVPVPCGALEEADLIWAIRPDSEATNFSVNLRGHGSIVLASSTDFLKDISWKAREVPELFL